MKKILLYSSLAFLMTCLWSCEEWLDVELKTKVKSEDLLLIEQGYKDALIGVYSNMISENLYGRELSFGFFEALTGAYDVSSANPTYYDVATGKLSNSNVKNTTDNFWKGLYNVIANVNNILDNIDNDKDLFSGDNYSIIKGEAMALRAFLHLEIFKIFGDFTDLSLDAIPYIKSLQTTIVNNSSGQQVLADAMQDLDDALKLLENDPIRKSGTKTNPTDAFLNDRQMRMNYYATKAIYARAAMYANDKVKALKYATEVINDGKNLFPWVDPATITLSEENNRDFTFSSEQLFCLNVFNLKSLYTIWLSPDVAQSMTLSKGTWFFNKWYEITSVGSTDYRLLYLTKTATFGWSTRYIVMKYIQPDAYNPDYAQRIPLIRMSEMYYIAAECNIDTDIDAATDYLNTVRRNRGINAPLSSLTSTTVAAELQKEYVKEFWGEGQLFFFFKRRNLISNPTDRYISFPLNSAYTISRPDSEIEYNK